MAYSPDDLIEVPYANTGNANSHKGQDPAKLVRATANLIGSPGISDQTKALNYPAATWPVD